MRSFRTQGAASIRWSSTRRIPARTAAKTRERDFYTWIHWLVRKRAERRTAYRLVLDHRHTKHDSLGTLQDVLDNAIRLDLRVGYPAMREVIARDSKDEPLIQLADILIGAVSHHFNELHLRPGASMGKCETAKHIGLRAGFRNGVIRTTYRTESKFNVWLWRSI